MNKIMSAFGAATLLASASFAVDSNVVGYSNKTVGDDNYDSNFKIVMNMFRNADGSEATMTLGSIKTNQAFDDTMWDCTGFGTGDTIQLFGVDGKSKGLLTYCSKSYIENACFTTGTEGWYTYDDAQAGVFTNCKNDTVLKFGEGFIVQAGKGNGTLPDLTFSGEVKSTESELPGVAFSFAGNCSPSSIKLGAIKTNQAFDEGIWDCTGFGTGDTIQFFTQGGQSAGLLTYCSKSYIENACFTTATEGWYTYDDAQAGIFTSCLNNNDVEAGGSFIMQCGSGNGIAPIITIPSALPSAE